MFKYEYNNDHRLYATYKQAFELGIASLALQIKEYLERNNLKAFFFSNFAQF